MSSGKRTTDGSPPTLLRTVRCAFLRCWPHFWVRFQPRLYFFEEIDNGIHPSRLHLLIDLIERQTTKEGIQVVTTTHSPDLLSMVSDSAYTNTSVVSRLEETDDAIIRPIHELPNATALRKDQGLGSTPFGRLDRSRVGVFRRRRPAEMNILVIPEDFRNDQYILRPIFKKLMRNLGKRHAHVRVCHDPLLGGIDQALRAERIQEIIDQYRGMTDIFILCVDRDGVKGRRAKLNRIEKKFRSGCIFLAQNAWEEIETWVLAGLDLPTDWSWADVRAEVQVKEKYFEKLAAQRGVTDGPGGGRKTLGEEAARRISAIRQKCREDFDALAERIRDAI